MATLDADGGWAEAAAGCDSDLGWTPRPLRDSILDTAESLFGAGIVRPRKHAPTG
jgi:hypothetical protein